MTDYDFDVANYSYIELCDFFKIPTDTINESEITKKIDQTIKKYSNVAISSNNNGFISFLGKSKEKLLNYIKQKPTNYDIIHSKSHTEGGSHVVTIDKIIPVVNTNEYKYPAGVVNPIEKRYITKIINIDTLFRSNYDATNPSDFTWELPTQLNNIVSMTIASLELPNVWYTVSSKNGSNWFKVYLYNMMDETHTSIPDTSIVVEIPDGNYMSAAFIQTINAYFQNVGGGLEFLVVTIDATTTKTTIRARNELIDMPPSPAPYYNEDSRYSPNFYFEIEFINPDQSIISQENCKNNRRYNPMQKSIGWFIGFRKPKYTIIKDTMFIDNTSYYSNGLPIGLPINLYGNLTSESAYGNSLHNYIFVEVNDFNKNFITDSITSLTTNAYIGDNILGRISVSSLPHYIIFNNESDCVFKSREYLGPVKISRLNIRLINKFGESIDLNNNDFSLALEFKMIY